MFTDGLSTTAPSMLYNLYCLATNQESQERVFQEVSSVSGQEESINASHLAQMPFLKAFVRETFRLWPIATEVSRTTEKQMVLSGYEIPAGTHVDLNTSVHFRDPQIFKNPLEHIPERWLKKQQGKTELESSVHPHLLNPFSHGTRMCPGRRQEVFFYNPICAKFFFYLGLLSKTCMLSWQHCSVVTPWTIQLERKWAKCTTHFYFLTDLLESDSKAGNNENFSVIL